MAGQIPTSFPARDEVIADCTADVLVKLLMGKNISLDVTRDPYFRVLLEGVAQNGRCSCKMLENSTTMRKSLLRLRDKIHQYMRMVIQSWKTTGCTVMIYNLKKMVVLGFYCPKGFIFFEMHASEQGTQGFWNVLGKALDVLAPNESYNIENLAIQSVRHDASYHSECQYQAVEFNDVVSLCTEQTACIRQKLQVLWRMICKKCKWVQRLIRKSDEVYECIITADFSEKLFTALKEKGFEKVSGSYASLGMIMKVEFELKVWVSELSTSEIFHLQTDNDVVTIIMSDEFWNDGKELLQVLAPLFKIPDLLDTLVPSAGYLNLAIANARGLLSAYSHHKPLKYKQICDRVDIWIHDCFPPIQMLASLFNPAYIFKQDVLEMMNFEEISVWLFRLAEAFDDHRKQALVAEIKVYSVKSSNPFAYVPISEWEANHPITLWTKYGDGLPLLRKVAYKLLSQPACCLNAQVEKHMSKLEGVDNLMLRLNALMREEFTKMGNEVYKPIQVKKESVGIG